MQAGFLYDATGRYDTSFFMAGSFLVIAGCISVAADIVWRKKNLETKKLYRK